MKRYISSNSLNKLFAYFDLNALFIYLFINSLMVWKYSAKISFNGGLAVIVYITVISCIIYLAFAGSKFKIPPAYSKPGYFLFIAVISTILFVIMKEFDPNDIDVGRFHAINDWLTRTLNFEYPYDSVYKPSGFPFLFVLVLPFHLLGDAGLFQIFSFIIFSSLIFYRLKGNDCEKYSYIILLIFSPIFMFEVVVRSELFSNMTMVLLILLLGEKYYHKSGVWKTVLFGLIAGLLLSTRGIVLLIYIVYFGYYYKNQLRNLAIFSASVILGFTVTLLPLYIWNSTYFIMYGPFAVQMSYAPGWMIILAVLISIAALKFINSFYRVYMAITWILFGVTLAALINYVIKFGLIESIIYHKFDISYFIFPLPFLIMTLITRPDQYPPGKSNQSGNSGRQ